MADKSIGQRVLSWLHGDDLAARREAKGQFEYTPYSTINNWSNPLVPTNAFGTYGGSIDYSVEAGDLVDSSAVMVCLNWLMRTFPQSRPRVVLETPEGYTPVPNHPLTALLKRPNPFYSGTQLWRGTVLSYYWDGNAYWRKVRNAQKQVIQLWYEPHWQVRPVRTSSEDYISKYQLWRYPNWVDVPTEDIVHLKWAFAVGNQMTGMAPLASALREVFTDNEAARYAAVMFRNMGVPGMIVTPKTDEISLGAPGSPGIERLKQELKQLTTGDNRGEPLLYDMPIDITFPQTDPGKMNTRENRKISEERISALLGTPAQVVGLGAGLDRNILGSPEEALRWAYNNNILPTQDSMAEELDIQLLPDFTNVEAQTIEFDQTKIDTLKGDQAKKDTVAALLYTSGVAKLSEARIRAGFKPAADGSEDVYKTQAAPPPLMLPQPQDATQQDGNMLPPPQKSLADILLEHELALVHTNGHKE